MTSIMAAWTLSTVGDQFDVQLGKMLDAAQNIGEPKPYVGNRAVQWERIDVSAVGSVPMTLSDVQRYRLRRGDLLVCEGGEVGRAAIWRDELPECYFQKALHRLRAKSSYDVRLMLAFLEYWASLTGFSNYVTQTSIAHLSREKFIQIPLPVPEESEQKQLSDLFDDVHREIEALEHLIAKKRAIKQGMMQQLLTSRARLPGFTAPWSNRQLGDLLVRPPRYGVNAPAVRDAVGTYRYIRITDIDEWGDFAPRPLVGVRHPKAAEWLLQPGELVFARTGASVGKSYFYDPCDGGLVYAGFLINVAPDPTALDPKYLAQFARSHYYWEWVARISVRSGQPGINGREYAQMPITLPNIQEQHAIADVLEDIDSEIDVLRKRLGKAREAKQGMMQQLLTGRTRLPVQETAS
jgi:type I restriction enzyme, S subunit